MTSSYCGGVSFAVYITLPAHATVLGKLSTRQLKSNTPVDHGSEGFDVIIEQ